MKKANHVLSHKHLKIVFVCFWLNKCAILAIDQKGYIIISFNCLLLIHLWMDESSSTVRSKTLNQIMNYYEN